MKRRKQSVARGTGWIKTKGAGTRVGWRKEGKKKGEVRVDKKLDGNYPIIGSRIEDSVVGRWNSPSRLREAKTSQTALVWDKAKRIRLLPGKATTTS